MIDGSIHASLSIGLPLPYRLCVFTDAPVLDWIAGATCMNNHML